MIMSYSGAMSFKADQLTLMLYPVVLTQTSCLTFSSTEPMQHTPSGRSWSFSYECYPSCMCNSGSCRLQRFRDWLHMHMHACNAQFIRLTHQLVFVSLALISHTQLRFQGFEITQHLSTTPLLLRLWLDRLSVEVERKVSTSEVVDPAPNHSTGTHTFLKEWSLLFLSLDSLGKHTSIIQSLSLTVCIVLKQYTCMLERLSKSYIISIRYCCQEVLQSS